MGVEVGGDEISTAYLGSSELSEIHLGDEKIWPLTSQVPDPADYFSGQVYAFVDLSDSSTYNVSNGKVDALANQGTLGGVFVDFPGGGGDHRPTLSVGGAPNGTDCIISDVDDALYADFGSQGGDDNTTLVAVFAVDSQGGTESAVAVSPNGVASYAGVGGSVGHTLDGGVSKWVAERRGASARAIGSTTSIGQWIAAACILTPGTFTAGARLLTSDGDNEFAQLTDSGAFWGRISFGGATTNGGRCRFAMGAVISGRQIDEAQDYLAALATHYGL